MTLNPPFSFSSAVRFLQTISTCSLEFLKNPFRVSSMILWPIWMDLVQIPGTCFSTTFIRRPRLSGLQQLSPKKEEQQLNYVVMNCNSQNGHYHRWLKCMITYVFTQWRFTSFFYHKKVIHGCLFPVFMVILLISSYLVITLYMTDKQIHLACLTG